MSMKYLPTITTMVWVLGVINEGGSSYLPSEILSGKLFIDDYEVTSLQFSPATSSELLLFETDYDYGFGASFKGIQYRPTTTVAKGTLDIM